MNEIGIDAKLYRCECGELAFLEVIHDDDDDFYYFNLTYYPKSFWQKIVAMWYILKGARYGASEEIVLTKENAQDLSNFIQHFKKYGKKAIYTENDKK